MNILNKGFVPFYENGNALIYNKVLTGNFTAKRLNSIENWIDYVNKKTKHICYGFFYTTKGVKYYNINIEVFNSDNL